ncbi:hypothetical protein KVV02_002990 [Mortierella alpina]|uniref:Spore coat protein CotH n=1 Tax=Mortierella alpina TaxID=64518 RepID=A0A9P8A6B8_MORAP|nr:hypothetical protein KVV02_002990 [Mortierella alpina]
MRSYLLPGLLAVISGALADVTYNVVGFPDTDGGSFGVSVTGKVTKLTTTPETFPLWSGNVAGVTASSKYRYVKLAADGSVIEQESFSRAFANSKDTATLNEFYMRRPSNKLKALPQVYKDVRPKASPAFDDNHIGTVHMTADPAAYEDMMANPLDEEKKAIKANFCFINAHTTYCGKEVKLKISGHGSRKYQKLSLRIKFDEDKGETFFDRPIVKFRSSSNDPTQMREKIYFDNLVASGVPTAQGAYVRVFVNGKPYGFCLMAEDIETPYIRTTIHGGSLKTKELGSLYQMGSHVVGYEASLLYNGSKTADYHPEIYSNKNLGDPTKNTKEEPMAQLIQFLKELYEYDPAMAGGEKFWRSRLDLDGFLRSMALEYLGGAWDSYWWKGNNYFMYFNPTKNVWQFLPTDFDSTFSNGTREDVDVVYKQFAASRLRRSGKDHPLISKVIYKNAETNKLFEKTLLEITQKVFNPTVLNPRIDAIKLMIQEDVKWDYSIDRSKRPGKNPRWTMADFNQSIIGAVKGISHGIKPWIDNRAKSVPKQVKK